MNSFPSGETRSRLKRKNNHSTLRQGTLGEQPVPNVCSARNKVLQIFFRITGKAKLLTTVFMNGYDENRRRFLTKLGLTLGVTLTGTVVMQEPMPSTNKLTISADQQLFMSNYERWMDDFIVVIKYRRRIQTTWKTTKRS